MNALDELIDRPVSWLASPGEHAGIVVSSRVRLARNIRGQHFRRQLDQPDQEHLVDSIMATASSVCTWPQGLRLSLRDLSDTERQALSERRLVSRELANSDKPAGALVSEDERISLMINEEDHVRLQVMEPGLAITKALNQAVAIDQRLEEVLPWAVHPRYGYLTSCPTNVGTGLRISVMLHLPGLAESKELARALRGIGKLHFTVRGLFGEGSEASGQYYQVSNQRTLGATEEEIAQSLSECMDELIRYELVAREALLDHRRVQLEDHSHRAWGILTQARRLSSDELMEQLSWLRLGMAVGLIDYRHWQTLDRIFLRCQPAHLQLKYPQADESETRDELRATLVRDWLSAN